MSIKQFESKVETDWIFYWVYFQFHVTKTKYTVGNQKYIHAIKQWYCSYKALLLVVGIKEVASNNAMSSDKITLH